MKFYLFCLSILTFSCNNLQRRKIVTIQKGDIIIKGDIESDTLYNDTISYYDLKNNLLSKRFFKCGREYGMSIEYRLNKVPMKTTEYSNGLKNGFNSYFDSSGQCIYRDFYYYDLPVGPAIFFEKNGKPSRFYFLSLQNETLLDINYKNWNGIADVHSKCINFITNIQMKDSVREISLLLYVISPPKFSFEYSILKKKKTSKDNFEIIEKVRSHMPFINVALPILPDDDIYSIGLNVYDSILNKKSVIYEDF